jgi:carbamate kinase
VIACGGGGVPIKKNADDSYAGVEAVIDKDLTSSVLATDVGAALLIILTAVPQVYLNFGTRDQRALGAVTLEEIESLAAQGHFPPGSMAPRSKPSSHFLKNGGRRALITNPESLRRPSRPRGHPHRRPDLGGLSPFPTNSGTPYRSLE